MRLDPLFVSVFVAAVVMIVAVAFVASVVKEDYDLFTQCQEAGGAKIGNSCFDLRKIDLGEKDHD